MRLLDDTCAMLHLERRLRNLRNGCVRFKADSREGQQSVAEELMDFVAPNGCLHERILVMDSQGRMAFLVEQSDLDDPLAAWPAIA